MTTEVLPVFAGGLLETAVRAFECERVDRWGPVEVRQGIGFFDQLHSALRAVRRALHQELELGVEARSFVARYQPVADGLNRFFAVVTQARQALADLPAPTGAGALVAEIAAAEKEGQALREFLAEALAKATTPIRIDPERLKQAEADIAAGRIIRVETLEDLFGEAPGA